MSDLGLGVMIKMLGGNEESVNALKEALNKKIKEIDLNEYRLFIGFTDGSKITLSDEGQSCCEERYMHSDDKDSFPHYIGSELIKVELKEAPQIESKWGTHEVMFMVVTTSKGAFTIETHNEHNGFYGGFWVVCKAV
jgi:hypothetical protein